MVVMTHSAIIQSIGNGMGNPNATDMETNALKKSKTITLQTTKNQR